MIHLKVKIKSLAVEARIIRLEERKAKKWGRRDLLTSLQDHRRKAVRSEARASQLAYAFLRGRPYREVEPKTRPGNEPDWARIASCIDRFGPSKNTFSLGLVNKWSSLVA